MKRDSPTVRLRSFSETELLELEIVNVGDRPLIMISVSEGKALECVSVSSDMLALLRGLSAKAWLPVDLTLSGISISVISFFSKTFFHESLSLTDEIFAGSRCVLDFCRDAPAVDSPAPAVRPGRAPEQPPDLQDLFLQLGTSTSSDGWPGESSGITTEGIFRAYIFFGRIFCNFALKFCKSSTS